MKNGLSPDKRDDTIQNCIEAVEGLKGISIRKVHPKKQETFTGKGALIFGFVLFLMIFVMAISLTPAQKFIAHFTSDNISAIDKVNHVVTSRVPIYNSNFKIIVFLDR